MTRWWTVASSFLHHLLEIELAPLGARLVHGDLLEARYQIGGLGEVVHHQVGRLQIHANVAVEAGAFESAGIGFGLELCALVAQGAGHDQRIAQRGVELVRNARDQRAQCRELLRSNQIVLRELQRLQCVVQFPGAFRDPLLQRRVEPLQFLLRLLAFRDVEHGADGVRQLPRRSLALEVAL